MKIKGMTLKQWLIVILIIAPVAIALFIQDVIEGD